MEKIDIDIALQITDRKKYIFKAKLAWSQESCIATFDSK